MVQPSASSIDIDSFWEYSEPAVSEARFRAALSTVEGDLRLELLTQIARTYGMRGRFDEAHALLDQVEGQLSKAGPRPRLRCLLERGRAFNSSGAREKGRVLFIEAWGRAQAAHLDGLAVDAAHMAAISCAGSREAIEWTRNGLELARASQDPKARALIPAMLNNGAWDLHDMGRLNEALAMFKEAQAAWEAEGKPAQIRVAKWALGRCLRSMRRYGEALAIQRALEIEHVAAGSVDGFVFEEIAENLTALGKMDQARPYFEKAAIELSKDDWFVRNEAARLANLKRLAGRS
jgi:tetratricopeptide (TPR) repeat protein